MKKEKYHDYSRWEHGESHAIKITPRILDLLHQLFLLLGPVPTPMLHLLAAPDITIGATRARLKLMKRNPNNLIEQPKQQRLAYNANYAPLSYRITNAGVQALLNKERITKEEADLWFRLQQNYKTYHHDAATAYYIASIKLGCVQTGRTFDGWEYTLTHRNCPQETKDADNPLAMRIKVDGKTIRVIPDWPPFAIGGPEGKSCYVLENDMHNEPIAAHELNRSSYGQKLVHYLEVFRSREYQAHFGIPNLQILNVTVSDIHMNNIIKHLQRISTKTRPFLFKSVPSMSKYENKPDISGHMLTAPWQRVDEQEVYLHR